MHSMHLMAARGTFWVSTEPQGSGRHIRSLTCPLQTDSPIRCVALYPNTPLTGLTGDGACTNTCKAGVKHTFNFVNLMNPIIRTKTMKCLWPTTLKLLLTLTCSFLLWTC